MSQATTVKLQFLHFTQITTIRFGIFKLTVVVCGSGYYGEDCRQLCSINCNFTTHCNKVTGQCEGGCKPGWKGSKCDQSMNL